MDGAPYTKIIVCNMRVDMSIGIHAHEKQKKQPVIVNVEAFVSPLAQWQDDNISGVLNYEVIVSTINEMTKSGHIDLVETLAEKIASFCLTQNKVHSVMVRVEKPEIFDTMDSVGVEIFRTKDI